MSNAILNELTTNMDFSAIGKMTNHIWQVVQLMAVIWNILLLVVLCRLKSPRRSCLTLIKRLTVADLLLPFLFLFFSLCLEHCPILNNISMYATKKLLMMNRYSTFVILIHLNCLAVEHFVAIM